MISRIIALERALADYAHKYGYSELARTAMNYEVRKPSEGPISGSVLMALRRRIELGRVSFGRAIGLEGDDLDVHYMVWRLESGRAASNDEIEERALLLLDRFASVRNE
jgi:hypothetical protein